VITLNRAENSINENLVSQVSSILVTQRCTKRTAVRLAIINCIRNGVLKPGTYLPSEISMAKILNVSLGTVQVALGQLRDIGLIQRRRGDGSRVSNSEPIEDTTWHFRFSSVQNGKPLRMIRSELQISKTSEHGYWSDFLGEHREYLCISRRVLMHDETRVGAKMFIPIGIAPNFEEINKTELNMLNIRSYLETRLKLKITKCKNRVSVCTPNESNLKEFGLIKKEPHFEINATVFIEPKTPVYHQYVLAPTSDINLEF
jgi:DNA-binding GntR family transcriptional regulator